MKSRKLTEEEFLDRLKPFENEDLTDWRDRQLKKIDEEFRKNVAEKNRKKE